MMRLQLATVDTPGEMGTVANLEQHTRNTLKFLTDCDELITQAQGAGLPPEAEVSKSYLGTARIVVPTVRTLIDKGESLRIKAMVLDKGLPQVLEVCWRPLGKGTYNRIRMRSIGRATYEAKLPSAESSFEYYIDMKTVDGGRLVWPASAPEISQTVVMW